MRTIVCTVLLASLLFVPVFAENASLDVSAVEDGLTEEAREVSGPLTTDGSYDMHGALARLFDRTKEKIVESARGEARELTRILAVAVLCAAAEAFCPDGRMRELVSLCSCAAVVMITSGSVDSLAGDLTESIDMLCSYARTALPCVFTAAAVSGAVVSAGAKYAAVSLCMSVLTEVLRRITIPLIYAYLALCISRCACPNPVLNAACSKIKWLCVATMTVLAIMVSAYISLTGALTGGADAIAVKGTRTVIASALPVVGGILSDAASVVLASASVIKNSAGTFALIGVCALCLGPIIAIGVKLLLFRFCAAVAAAAEGKRLAALLGDLSAAMGMMLGVLGTMSIILFISLMAAIRTVSA